MRKRLRIRAQVVENQRPTQTLNVVPRSTINTNGETEN